tara:strand:+ start:473 stop:1009 length:537 start_codon:yes stop_codon:yes gene_type:complete
MSDNYTYSRPYGEAAFKMALEGNVIDQWSDNLKTLSKVIADKDIKAVLADPKISQSACASLLLGFLNVDDNHNLSNFINLLLGNKRIFYISEISEIFDDMKASHKNVRIVEVETSHKLQPEQIKSLKSLFKNKYKSDIEIEEIVNEKLLAGIKVKVDDEVIDLSLQNRFNQIKQQLII